MKCPKCQSENPNTVKFCGECGTNFTSAEEAKPTITKTIETPREELTTGSTFAGRYQIIEELGKGGMGKVYKANDKDIKEKVAIKLIKLQPGQYIKSETTLKASTRKFSRTLPNVISCPPIRP